MGSLLPQILWLSTISLLTLTALASFLAISIHVHLGLQIILYCSSLVTRVLIFTCLWLASVTHIASHLR